jgi:hypothetical protein
MAQTDKIIFSKRFQAGFFILVFGFLTGFSPILHNHEFDLEEAHQDCAPCEWSQDNVESEVLCVSLSFSPLMQSLSNPHADSFTFDDSYPVLNKSPPILL